MIKIFEKIETVKSWENKVNFVDTNNVFVGYDMMQNCCESFGWEICSDTKRENLVKNPDLSDYVFDINFVELNDMSDPKWDDIYISVVFKMIAEGKDDLYLHLYNNHNGYYAHGFETSGFNKELKVNFI